ncbi:MAG: hypothetical protein ACOVP6_06695 [Lacibacter sp.]
MIRSIRFNFPISSTEFAAVLKDNFRRSGVYYFIFYIAAFVLFSFLFSCSGSRKSNQYKEKDLQMLMKRLNKRGSDAQVIEDIKTVYLQRSTQSLQRIEQYQYEEAPFKWDQIILETEYLQRMYDIIQQNPYALQTVQPINYRYQLQDLTDSAAAAYYNYGIEAYQQIGRSQKRIAYESFQKCLTFQRNYKDAFQKMREAFDSAIVHVLINKMQFEDFRYMFFMGSSLRHRPVFSVVQMVSKLEGNGNQTIPARFYSESNLLSENRAPDHVVDMIWRNVQFNTGNYQTRTYERSKQIEIGRDTSNQPVYQTVYANLTVLESAIKSTGEFHILVTDAVNRRMIKSYKLPAQYQYSFEYATFTGDKRALQNTDWTLVNRKGTERLPTREVAMERMMENVYQETVSSIRKAVNW